MGPDTALSVHTIIDSCWQPQPVFARSITSEDLRKRLNAFHGFYGKRRMVVSWCAKALMTPTFNIFLNAGSHLKVFLAFI